MAATYAQLGIIAETLEFQQRVRIAANLVAANVYVEGAGVAGHVPRLAFALRVATANYNPLAMCYLVATNPTIVAEATVPATGQPPNGNGISDAHILAAITAVWSPLAGV